MNLISEHPGPGSKSRRRQIGASAVEFALIFPILFVVMYGAIVYAYAFALKQSITFAAQEAAEAAVDVRPELDDDAYIAQVQASSDGIVRAIVRWMPSSLRNNVQTLAQFCSEGAGGPATACDSLGGTSDAVVVTVTLPLTGNSQLFAEINLPLVGTFPPLPANMTAVAAARV